MKKVMVRYKVKPAHVAENESLIREVYKQLQAERPPGFRYSTFKLSDGVSFVHLAIDEDDLNPLPKLEAFKNFQAALKDRCDELPLVDHVTEIGSFTGSS